MLDQAQREQLVALLTAGIRRRSAAQRDEEPAGDVFGHSSMELASYGDFTRPKSLILLQLETMQKFYFFGHTQWRRARKNKRTAHGGKAAVAAILSRAGRRDAYPTNSRRSRPHLSVRVSRMNQKSDPWDWIGAEKAERGKDAWGVVSADNRSHNSLGHPEN